MNTLLTRLQSRGFLLKILLPAILTLGLFVISLYQIIIPRFEDIIMGRKREMIRELTNSAWHVADHYHGEMVAGRMTEEDAKAAAIAQVSHLRYGDEGKDYFWITDYHPVMIVHPFREDLNGTDLTDFADSRGKKLFVEIVKVVRSDGEGYVDYTWQWKDDSTRIVPKLSYVKPFKPWGWIIGTGIYLEDVRAEIAGLEQDIVRISLWITVTITLLLLLIVLQNVRSERKRRQAENEMREAKEKYEALVEASTEGLLMLLDGSEEPFLNRSLLAMSGYSDIEAPRLSWSDLLPGIDLRTVRPASATGEDPEESDNAGEAPVETALRCKDGSEIDVILTASEVQVFGKNGTVVIVRDVSQHKEISNALTESREQFLALTRQLPYAVFRTDAGKGMRVLEGNAAAADIFGLSSAADFIGTEFAGCFEDEYSLKSMTDELFATGVVSHRIARFLRVDKLPIDLSFSIVLVRDDDGRPRYCDVLAEDASRNVRHEEDTKRLLNEMQAPLLFLAQPIASMVRPALRCSMRDPLGGVARMLSRSDCSTALVHNDAGELVGMLGVDELRHAILQGGSAADLLAYEVMRAPLLRLSVGATMHEALIRMTDANASAVVVMDEDGDAAGVIGLEDIHRSELQTSTFFLRQLQRAESVAEVGQCMQRLTRYVALLIESGAGMRHVTHALAMIYDTAVRRIVSLVLAELGPPPRAFAFLALGSQGRSEQTLATDQDNAIIYAAREGGIPGDDGDEDEQVHAYFLRLGQRICQGLNEAGFPYCRGEVMAMNPKWCQPLPVWKRYFTEWITTSNPQDLLEINIFFDFRCIFGQESLGQELREHVLRTASSFNSFFIYLAQNALRVKPPAWQFKAAETVDVKMALLPIVDLARIYSLRQQVLRTNTPERLEALHEKGVFSTGGYRDLAQVYDLLMSLRFRHQARAIIGNTTAGNIIPTGTLSDLEKTTLRRAFSLIETFQSKLSLDFKGTM
ncbi:MAG: cache domain-containing protein [Bacteroidetes bacterium]|nr:cache domain-containing protein [Bacteroidota bacterium]